MRARNIKPGFFKNDLLAETGAIGMVLFSGLWLAADREGRLEDRPLRIRAEILPYFDCDVEALLEALAVRGFIHRYQASDGRRFIQVVNWKRHQSPHVKEPESTIPAPDESGARPTSGSPAPGGDPQKLHVAPDSTVHAEGAATNESGRSDRAFGTNGPELSSGNKESGSSTIQEPDKHQTCVGTGSKPAQSENQEIKESGISESRNPESEYGAEFELTWAAYPKRAGSNPKRDAGKAWSARMREPGVTAELLIGGVRRYAAFCRETGKIGTEFVMQAATFFGPGERWRQDWELPTANGSLRKPKETSMEMIQRLGREVGNGKT